MQSDKIYRALIVGILSTFWLFYESGYEPFTVVLTSFFTVGFYIYQLDSKKTIVSVPLHLEDKKFILETKYFSKNQIQSGESFIIDESILYIDNDNKSKNLVFMFHGLGLDHNDFRQYIEKSNYRCLAPTLYGFDKDSTVTEVISYQTHCLVLYQFITRKIYELKPKTVTLLGFSIGSDMIQDILKDHPSLAREINSIVLLECNISIDSCLISEKISSISVDKKNNTLDVIRSLGEDSHDTKEWIQVHQYLVKVLSKFQHRRKILSKFYSDD